MLWQHDAKNPIGVWHEIFEDKYGLYVSGQLLLDTQLGKTALSLMQAGAIDSLSVGFCNKYSTINRKLNHRQIHQAELFEVSLVTFAANPAARIINTSQAKLDSAIKKLTHKIKSAV
jgi:HK97 family phage prohead protease